MTLMDEWEEIKWGPALLSVMSYNIGFQDGYEKARVDLGQSVQRAYDQGFNDGVTCSA